MSGSRRAAALVMLALCLLLAGCSFKSLVRRPFFAQFPKGFTSCEEHFDPEATQDSVDYCKYFYPDAEGFKADLRFMPVSEVGTESIEGYFENFRGWMETCGRLSEYDFDPAVISGDDFVKIRTEPHFTEYDDYTLWYFDVQSCTMYYIHANI